MYDFERPRMGDLATELGLRPKDTVLDVAMTVYEWGQELLGDPFGVMDNPAEDALSKTHRSSLLGYSSREEGIYRESGPTHVETVELGLMFPRTEKSLVVGLTPQHLLRIERETIGDPADEPRSRFSAISGMDIVRADPAWNKKAVLGQFTIRAFYYGDKEVREILGRTNTEGYISVPGLPFGRSVKNEDKLPADHSLGKIVQNEVQAAGERLYVGWGFTFTLAHLLAVMKRVEGSRVY